MVLKIKSKPSFERGDHIESLDVLRWPLDDLWGQSWPLMTKITSSLDSLASKTYEKWCHLFIKPFCKDKFCFSYTLYSMYYPLLLSRHERYRNIAMKMDLRLIHNYNILQIPKKIQNFKFFKILKFVENFWNI